MQCLYACARFTPLQVRGASWLAKGLQEFHTLTELPEELFDEIGLGQHERQSATFDFSEALFRFFDKKLLNDAAFLLQCSVQLEFACSKCGMSATSAHRVDERCFMVAGNPKVPLSKSWADFFEPTEVEKKCSGCNTKGNGKQQFTAPKLGGLAIMCIVASRGALSVPVWIGFNSRGKKLRYNLVAVVLHQPGRVGHYKCRVRGADFLQWYACDDARVQDVKPTGRPQSGKFFIYAAFYVRVG
jgi:hypothetical protein